MPVNNCSCDDSLDVSSVMGLGSYQTGNGDSVEAPDITDTLVRQQHFINTPNTEFDVKFSKNALFFSQKDFLIA